MCGATCAGAQIPLEDVPSVQKEVVVRCRQAGKAVIVASHLLQSMIEYPTPTRAEVGLNLLLSPVLSPYHNAAYCIILQGDNPCSWYGHAWIGCNATCMQGRSRL